MATIEDMIYDIHEADGTMYFNLSDWEKEFLDSIEDWFADNDDLTDKQIDKLTEIWNKI